MKVHTLASANREVAFNDQNLITGSNATIRMLSRAVSNGSVRMLNLLNFVRTKKVSKINALVSHR